MKECIKVYNRVNYIVIHQLGGVLTQKANFVSAERKNKRLKFLARMIKIVVVYFKEILVAVAQLDRAGPS